MRNSVLVRVLALGLGLALLAPSLGFAQTPRRGGQLVVAMEGEPPDLDMHLSALNYLRYIAYHVNEQLFTLDANFHPIPMLAQGYTISPNGKLYTITLRSGVKFHNGQELTSADVVASLSRWVRRSGVGQTIAYNVAAIRAVDAHTVQIELKTPMPFVLIALAAFRQGSAIYTKSAIDQAGQTGPITDYNGTGPYRLVEWRKGQYALLRRFDGYSARTDAPNGYGGRRAAYLDEIKFVFAAEPSVRAVGVQAGDFDFAWPVTTDDYTRLQADPKLLAFLSAPRMYTVLLNSASRITSNVLIRRAIQAAIDDRELMTGIFGDPKFWRLDPGIMWKETAWWSNTSASLYNQANPGRAKQLLAQAGYKGEPLAMVVSAQERIHLLGSQILKQQLERAGFTIAAQNLDVNASRAATAKPSGWEMTTMDSTYREHPILLLTWKSDFDFWVNPEKDNLMRRLLTVQNPAVAPKIWEQVQNLYYQDVPMVKVGDYFDLVVMQRRVKGYQNMPEPFFWNVWKER
jgi:peptide/nickel transport system substrate-binding protein